MKQQQPEALRTGRSRAAVVVVVAASARKKYSQSYNFRGDYSTFTLDEQLYTTLYFSLELTGPLEQAKGPYMVQYTVHPISALSPSSYQIDFFPTVLLPKSRAS